MRTKATHHPAFNTSRNAFRRDRTVALEKTGGSNMRNQDFKRGLYTGMGVLVAVYVFGLATGILKKIF